MARSFALSRRPGLRCGALGCLLLALACGDDGSGEGSETTGPMGSTGTPTPATSSTTMTPADSSTGEPGSSSGPAESSSSSGEGDTTGSGPEDPAYPRPVGGACSGNTAPVMLPGAEICSPFCTGVGDPCPDAASGDAPAECTPFLGAGGSGDPCDEVTPCAGEEVCSTEGTCGEVAFWACQLVCADGQACPEGMICSAIGTCGYP